MDRYQLFRMMMDKLAEDFEINDASMNNYSREIEIQGRCPGWEVSLRIVPVEEVQKDGN